MFSSIPAGIINAVFIFATFAASIPAIITHTRRGLKINGFMVAICALFTMVVGLYLWILTLETKAEMGEQWVLQTAEVQDLLQTEVSCCTGVAAPHDVR